MRAMLLAAGRGERLRPITDDTPKALVEVDGKSLLEHHFDRLRSAGVRTVVINLGWLGRKIVERIGSGSRYGLEVVYSVEGDDVLETGGGIHKALPILGAEPFYVINADIFTDMPLPVVELGEGLLGHLVMVPKPDYRSRGDFDVVDGRIRNAEAPQLTFSGVAIYRPTFFAGCEAGRFPLAPLLREAADEGTLGGTVYEGYWDDIGTPERLAAARR